MDRNHETNPETKEKLMKREQDETEFLEKELARERREEVSRMVADLERQTADREAERSQAVGKEAEWSQAEGKEAERLEEERKEAEKKEMGQKPADSEDRKKKAEEILRKVNQRKQEEEFQPERDEETQRESRRRKKGSGKSGIAAAGIGAALIAAAAGAYFLISIQYRASFLPGTVINGTNVSGMTAEEVRDLISRGIDSYTLNLLERGGNTETITRDDISLKAEFDGTLEKIIEGQDPIRWLPAKFSGSTYDIETMISYDEVMLAEKISNLECMKEENIIPPADAYVSEYLQGQGYVIVPEEKGNELNPDLVREKAGTAIQALRTELSLEEEGCYREPEITSDSPVLLERADNLNRYVKVTVTYKFGEKQEVLNGDMIHEWLINEDGHMDISLEGVKSYVQTLATKYNTSYRAKTLQTSYGKAVTITRGSYGWRIDQAAEAEALMEIILSGENQEREPIYAQTAASHGENDYGNTYVEINLTAQHLYFYKEGKLIVESDFVSGNVSKGHTTPPGAYPLTYKERNATLRGQGYASPVSFWMPFNGGIGMHDASWRSSFGGSIYRTNGSHGCINLPYAAAKTIYENIEKGMPVLCYNLDGTGNGGTTQSVTPPAQTQASETTEAAETVETTENTETQAPQGPADTILVPPTEAVQTQAPETTPSTEPQAPPVETPQTQAPDGPGSVVGTGGQEAGGPGSGL